MHAFDAHRHRYVAEVVMDDGYDTMADIGRLAAAEDRSVPELVREAVSLYVHLPAAARRSLRALAATGTGDDHRVAGQAAGRAIVQSGFDLARRRASDAAGRAYADEALATEEDVAEEAVRLARGARAAAG